MIYNNNNLNLNMQTGKLNKSKSICQHQQMLFEYHSSNVVSVGC